LKVPPALGAVAKVTDWKAQTDIRVADLLRYGGSGRVDCWYGECSDRGKARSGLVGHLVGLVPFTLLGIWVSWKPVRGSWLHWEMSPDPGGLPRAPIKAMILVAFILLGMQALASLIRLAAFFTGRDEELFIEREAPMRIE